MQHRRRFPIAFITMVVTTILVTSMVVVTSSCVRARKVEVGEGEKRQFSAESNGYGVSVIIAEDGPEYIFLRAPEGETLNQNFRIIFDQSSQGRDSLRIIRKRPSGKEIPEKEAPKDL